VARGSSPIVDALRKVPLFSGASDKELKRVAELAREEHFAAGEDIVTQGHSSGPFFLLTDGDAVVLVGDRERSKLGPGNFFGEMSLVDQEPRSATIRALSDVTALSISSWDFLTVLERHWDLTRQLLVELSRRVRALDQDPCL
jgi:CRP/FNR family cyclic AMP-dependent transcriptional regulator